MRVGTATRPRSWIKAERRTCSASTGSSRKAETAVETSSESPLECPTMWDTVMSEKWPIAARASSMAAPDSISHGRGSAARVDSHSEASTSEPRIPGASSTTSSAIAGSKARPALCSITEATKTSSPIRC